MDNYFESIVLEGLLRCEDFYIDKYRKGFSRLYPFVTENVDGYVKYFDLENKSLMTVGSSTDQAINARLCGAKDITVVDICPFTKFYFYLKVAAILVLDYNQFLEFFCYKDFPEFCHDNKSAFDLNQFKNIKIALRNLDYESYLFWDELFSNYPGEVIRKNLFSNDEYRVEVLKKINFYLRDEESFNKAKEEICKVFPKFIIGDISSINLDRKYDNIWLSNIGKYLYLDELKMLVDKMYSYLNDNGKMMVCYLYEFYKDSGYQEGWAEVYNLNEMFKTFKEYNLEAVNFTGMRDIIFEWNSSNDMILLCKKIKR